MKQIIKLMRKNEEKQVEDNYTKLKKLCSLFDKEKVDAVINVTKIENNNKPIIKYVTREERAKESISNVDYRDNENKLGFFHWQIDFSVISEKSVAELRIMREIINNEDVGLMKIVAPVDFLAIRALNEDVEKAVKNKTENLLDILQKQEEKKTELPDVQNQVDTRNKKINKVGIREFVVPITVTTPKGELNTVANVSAYVSLNEQTKGISMSRLPVIIQETIKNSIGLDIIDKLLDELKVKLGSTDSYVKFRFTYFKEKQAPVTKTKGIMHYNCILEGRDVDNVIHCYLTVQVPYTSLCPCSKEISKSGAHNQFSTLDVTVELIDFVDIEEIIELVDEVVSCPIYSVLKRPDEKYVTETAFNNPKFVEDVVRDVSLKLDLMLDKKISDYVLVANHNESIHSHVAVAILNAGRNLK